MQGGAEERMLQLYAAMENLKRKRLLFGISCCYTSQNTDDIGSEEYFDDMAGKVAQSLPGCLHICRWAMTLCRSLWLLQSRENSCMNV